MPAVQWREAPSIPIPANLADFVGGHPLVVRTLVRRGFTDPDQVRAFLDPGAYSPADPYELPDLSIAVRRLKRAVTDHEPLVVWGDFDVDGQTATTLLVSGLRSLGAQVSYHIPLRASESHGVNLPHLRSILEQEARLILTCDTGVGSFDALEFARKQGAQVIVTDHHDPPESLPPALAIVNPKLIKNPVSPLSALPGVGVAYQLLAALFAQLGRTGQEHEYLDLVALGIVADLALLTGDTRFLLQRGLERLRTPHRLGLRSLMEIAEVNPAGLSEEDIAFQLAPRLNALGRLADANLAVELLTTNELGRARILAQQLEGYNQQRKLLTSQVYRGALSQIEANPDLLDFEVLVLHHPAWPPGIVGIVASRLVETYAKPVVLVTTPPGEPGRGSARSVEGVNITAAITAAADLLNSFGGHPMAAGMSMDPRHIPEFRHRLSNHVAAQRAGLPPLAIEIDAFLSLSEVNLELADDLDRLAPFGPGNPPLLLAARDLQIARARDLGRSREHRLVTVVDPAGVEADLLWWSSADQDLPQGVFDLAFTMRSSAYGGQRRLQLTWQTFRQLKAPAVDISAPPTLEILDLRKAANPLRDLDIMRRSEPLQVWAEGVHKPSTTGFGRDELVPSPILAIWTTPPGWSELRQVLERVEPQKVIVFGVDPGPSTPRSFLERLAGLVKFVLRARDGRVRITELAAATAQRELAVYAGLDWLEARGVLRVESQTDGQILLSLGDGEITAGLDRPVEILDSLLAETRAFRTYFRSADLTTLLT